MYVLKSGLLAMENERHEFAFFYAGCSSWRVGQSFQITDKQLIHRLDNVLRLHKGDQITVFDAAKKVHVTITASKKGMVAGSVVAASALAPLSPSIDWFLPILERDAFEKSISALTSLGARTITPVVTRKSKREGMPQLERLERVMFAAAEQSKQFVLPHVEKQVMLEEALAHIDGRNLLLFDCHGAPALESVQVLKADKSLHEKGLVCLIGPEGGLTQVERELVTKQGALLCALTPTVLEAWQAVMVGMGLIRSCI